MKNTIKNSQNKNISKNNTENKVDSISKNFFNRIEEILS